MIIYRVENDKGKGFYQDGFYGKFPPVQRWYPILKNASEEAIILFLHTIHPKIDNKTHESVYSEKSDFVFGFSTEEELINWFPISILNDIKFKGGKILKYEIEEKFVKKFNRQCIFDISKSKLI